MTNAHKLSVEKPNGHQRLNVGLGLSLFGDFWVLTQQSGERQMAPFGHIIPISNQPVLARIPLNQGKL